jgi:curved DNA-binding protein CbpA
MSNFRQGTNYYDILEVPVDAPQNEIHQAYQRAKATYSTDNPALYSMFTKEEAKELTRLIEEAYTVLGNHAQRKAYDQTLHAQGSGPHRMPQTQTQAQTQAAPKPEPVEVNVEASAAGGGDAFIVRKRETAKAALPQGTGRTALSTYKIKDDFEKEIATREEWDGALLKRVREYKAVTLEQVSEATRVSKTYLGAVEADDYAKLPAPVFVRGFVVQMSRILGLNENKVANSYIKLLKAKSGQ